jgi:alkyl sulfatase BDS1-like metallo-beta-lactamase superfamily hydrolase
MSVAEGKAKLDDEIKSGKITLTGSQAKLDQFLSVFDSFDAWYNVVTPVVT